MSRLKYLSKVEKREQLKESIIAWGSVVAFYSLVVVLVWGFLQWLN